jgi:hypothetical protein
MQSFDVEGQTYQAPFPCGSGLSTQGELAEAQDFLDDADDRFDGTLSQAIDGLADLGLQFEGHLDLHAGLFGGWGRLLDETFLPTLVM